MIQYLSKRIKKQSNSGAQSRKKRKRKNRNSKNEPALGIVKSIKTSAKSLRGRPKKKLHNAGSRVLKERKGKMKIPLQSPDSVPREHVRHCAVSKLLISKENHIKRTQRMQRTRSVNVPGRSQMSCKQSATKEAQYDADAEGRRDVITKLALARAEPEKERDDAPFAPTPCNPTWLPCRIRRQQSRKRELQQ